MLCSPSIIACLFTSFSLSTATVGEHSDLSHGLRRISRS
ncbi:hypothetical protein MUK42_19008 [Musa troglodytarum]|uniref:Uncharacterized protein n=1 Tax=Musa troglodytarum TaxID=320322 RepID=A0A9E7GAI1_9LILI|nr:hypothetical protein MUK42_19008 [Musa troglodytarum]